MTIQQIQTAIDAKADARQIINMIADYIQANPGDGGGLTLYSGDGTIASDRTVDLNGNDLHFQQGGQDFLKLDPTLDDESSLIRSYNPTSGARSFVDMYTLNGEAGFELRAQNGTIASIEGFTDGTITTLAYTADNNIFPSAVAANFANDAAAAVGGIPIGGLYHTAGAAKIRLS